jgi:uncharacterized protein (UPF0332 family)
MTPKLKTKDVQRTQYANFLKKSEECFHSASNSFNMKEYNASAISAIHSCIAGCDSMCVYNLGKRSLGENHNDAIKLFKAIKENDAGIDKNANRISRILNLKNMAEYEERLVSKNEAEKILKDCGRLLEYIKTQLPQR